MAATLELLTSLASRSVSDARVRPYGIEVADLEIDFDAPRPIVVTRLLAACLRGREDELWSLPVQIRILLLLGISELSIVAPVEVHLACGCGETAVVELSAAELADFAESRRREPLVAQANGPRVRLRLPTGRDQLRWAQLAAGEPSARDVLAALVIDGELTDDLVVAVDRLLGEVDPLVELEVTSTCPACHAALARPVDLERIALTRLRHARAGLLAQVHALAATYHWTEATIAALPAWRRAEYAALVEARRA
jgi:hypothetical protein